MEKVKYYLLLMAFLIAINGFSQDNMLCRGHHWTQDEANLMMKEFAGTWDDLESWEERADMIRQGMIKGMKLD